MNGVIEVETDALYTSRHLLAMPPVPQSVRDLDPSIATDADLSARVDALGPSLDVDDNGVISVSTDLVYIFRRLLGLTPVPQSFRDDDPTIPSDVDVAAQADLLL